MIVFLGTKAMCVKLAGFMREIGDYKYVSCEQHPTMLRLLEKQLKLKPPDLKLREAENDLDCPLAILVWFAKCLMNLIVHWRFFKGGRVIITQGDTLSTLLACIAAKIYGLKLAHIEAGLRSHSLLHPFPEEMIRRIVSKFADYLFAPGEWAAGNLANETGTVVNTNQNTVYDTLTAINPKRESGKYIVASIHRQETIYNRERFTQCIEIIEQAAEIAPVRLILHRSSECQLEHYNLQQTLKANPRVELFGYFEYMAFMELVTNSLFVITDGGGLQEETYFLNVPCLILRDRTERREGIGETAYLSRMEQSRVDYFLQNYDIFRRTNGFTRQYPSRMIAQTLYQGGY